MVTKIQKKAEPQAASAPTAVASAVLPMTTQTYKPTAAMPPSTTAGGIGAAVTVSQWRQAYCGRMWR